VTSYLPQKGGLTPNPRDYATGGGATWWKICYTYATKQRSVLKQSQSI